MSAADQFTRRGMRIVDGRLDQVGRAVGIELLGRIVRTTPVDTGRARENWNVSKGSEDPTTREERREGAAISEGSAVMETLRLSKGEEAYITNGLPYIERLNDGYSKQAPSGYIQTTVRDMRAFVDRLVRGLRG